jgi:hypothetical protein
MSALTFSPAVTACKALMSVRIWQGKKWVRLERNAVVILAVDSLAAIGELGVHGT